jgi:lactoylglutathione lyase
LVFLATPNSAEEIELCQMPVGAIPVQVQSDLTHLAFEVDDLLAFADQLKAKGYELSDGPTPTGSGSMIAFIDAPEGYEVELIQRSPV